MKRRISPIVSARPLAGFFLQGRCLPVPRIAAGRILRRAAPQDDRKKGDAPQDDGEREMLLRMTGKCTRMRHPERSEGSHPLFPPHPLPDFFAGNDACIVPRIAAGQILRRAAPQDDREKGDAPQDDSTIGEDVSS